MKGVITTSLEPYWLSLLPFVDEWQRGQFVAGSEIEGRAKISGWRRLIYRIKAHLRKKQWMCKVRDGGVYVLTGRDEIPELDRRKKLEKNALRVTLHHVAAAIPETDVEQKKVALHRRRLAAHMLTLREHEHDMRKILGAPEPRPRLSPSSIGE